MTEKYIENLRYASRQLLRELGVLDVDSIEHNLSAGHCHAIIEIDKNPGVTVSKLANLLLISISKASRIVGFLTKKEWVKFNEGMDKREKSLHITPKGKEQVSKIDDFSKKKITGAFKYLEPTEIIDILTAVKKYSIALEKNRLLGADIKISTISTSRTLRKQVIHMITEIQKNEFNIPVTEAHNICILKAEDTFYYNNSYNFWYASSNEGKIIGSIGLKKINGTCAEVKKFFVTPDYRGLGIAKKLMQTLILAAQKHEFKHLFLGTVDVLKAAHKFYEKNGFTKILTAQLPSDFEICNLDSVFYQGDLEYLTQTINKT